MLAKDFGWELDLPFQNIEELRQLSTLFLKKASISLYDQEGLEINESPEEQLLRSPWPDAYEVPVIIIGKEAVKYASHLPHFGWAMRFSLIQDGNEISFIIHHKLDRLRRLEHYSTLKAVGFIEEPCLCNKPFLKDIDRRR